MMTSSSSSSANPQKPKGTASGSLLKQLKGLEPQEATAIWEALKGAIAQIHARNASQLSFEELYRSAYNLVY